MAQKLTKSVVDSIKPPDGSDQRTVVWDSSLAGFGVVVFPSGVKSFILQYRNAEGKSRRYTIGKLSDSLTCDQARKIAKDKSSEIHTGGDPMGHKRARLKAFTVNELLDDYLASPSFAGKAESTKIVDRGRIERHVRPLLGKHTADMLTSDVIRTAQKDIAEGKTAVRAKTKKTRGVAKVTGGSGTADKAVLILRAAYTWAISEDKLKDNPAAGIKVAQSGQRDTIMSDSTDYAALFSTLVTMEHEHRIRRPVADAIRFIALTGARKGEAAGLRWQYVDLRTGLVTLPPKAHKTGHKTGKPRIIALPAEAQAIIARQPDGEPTDFVFQPAKGEGPLVLARPWEQVRKEANLPEKLGLHGLRHSLASHLAMAGASSTELMTAMGHKQISTTQRYIHFAEQARSTLAERGAAMAMAGLAESQGIPKAEVVPMKTAKSSK